MRAGAVPDANERADAKSQNEAADANEREDVAEVACGAGMIWNCGKVSELGQIRVKDLNVF